MNPALAKAQAAAFAAGCGRDPDTLGETGR
jgi:hypothetical protein